MKEWRVVVIVCLVAGILSSLGHAWITGEPPQLLAGVVGALVSAVIWIAIWRFHVETGTTGWRLRHLHDPDDVLNRDPRPRQSPKRSLPTLRIQQGLCPDCGHNLRGDFDDGCAECGWGQPE